MKRSFWNVSGMGDHKAVLRKAVRTRVTVRITPAGALPEGSTRSRAAADDKAGVRRLRSQAALVRGARFGTGPKCGPQGRTA